MLLLFSRRIVVNFMDQEKISNVIKKIRIKNNMTQKEFAHKYNVTYQAVSKWENGRNLPDISILNKICDDYNVDLNEMLACKSKNKKGYVFLVSLIITLGVIVFISIMFYMSYNSDFSFKMLSTTCDNFTISGSIAYNQKKSSIYISNVEYCGGEDNTTYQFINCSLYENIDNDKILITSCGGREKITLEDFLKQFKVNVDDYKQNCKDYIENSLYLEIKAIDINGKVIVYEVPLNLEDSCKF